MIPKIIHYCWFSGDPYPEPIQECLASWHKLMPDWDFQLWDYDRIQAIDNVWLKECLAERKWAFAADFIRHYAVYHHGGVYLDIDCRLLQSLEACLAHQAFIGQEWSVHIGPFTTHRYLTSHCFGAEPCHPFIARCLQYYDDRHFILSRQSDLPSSLRYDETLLPQIHTEIARSMYGYDPRPSVNRHQVVTLQHTGPTAVSQLTIYPHRYFDCFNIYKETVCCHLALGSWRNEGPVKHTPSFRSRVKISFNYRLTSLFWRLGYILTKVQ